MHPQRRADRVPQPRYADGVEYAKTLAIAEELDAYAERFEGA
ncbi:hypothetical protein [Streptomyces viridochromogenes]|nr:hypothetical protein [Streptomyces viridochromogenes]